MNERIKELMEEAGIYDFVVESMGINEEMEKFAELIIRECAKVSIDAGVDSSGDFREGIANSIQRHFGVE